MRILVDDEAVSLEALTMEHAGQTLVWNADSYDRLARGEIEGIFREINSYWLSRPIAEQNAIFETYQKIHEVFETIFDSKRLHARLTDLTKELLDLHPLEEIRYWINVKSNLQIPASMKESYAVTDPQERTYLRSDYAGLMVLSLGLRPMVPVWGEYIRRIKEESGNEYKEYVAMGLLAKTQQIRSQPMQRLETYVEAWVGQDDITVASVLGGLGSSELPGWLLSQVLVRRLVLVDIGKSNDSNNLISNAYSAIRSSIDTLSRRFNGNVGDKRKDNEEMRDDNTSYMELYKIKQTISDGDLVTLSVYAEQMDKILQKIDPSADLGRLQACYDALVAGNPEISTHHLTLVQWTIRRVLPPRSIPSLTKAALMRVLAVTQCLLWHWGFTDLALLSTAKPYVSNRDVAGMFESRARIPKEAVARLVELYPHYQDIGSKQATDRQLNVACRAIDLLAKTITRTDWEVIAPEELLRSSKTPLRSRRMIVPADIKAQLADLVIFLAEREKAAALAARQKQSVV